MVLSRRTQVICRKGEFKNKFPVLLSFTLPFGGRAVFKLLQHTHLTLPLAGGSDAVAAGEGPVRTLSSLRLDSPRGRVRCGSYRGNDKMVLKRMVRGDGGDGAGLQMRASKIFFRSGPINPPLRASIHRD